jgi:CRISPR-associated protein Csm4
MKLFEYRFRLRSPVITPFDADTWFGHAAWAWRYLKGESEFLHWLHSLNESPVVFSDSFPQGTLPCPTLPPLKRNQSKAWIDGHFGTSMSHYIKGLDKLHQIRKCRHIPIDVLSKLASELNQNSLTEALYESMKEKPSGMDAAQDRASRLVLHNAINRNSGTVDEFFGTEEWIYPKELRNFHGYVVSESWDADDLNEIFKFIEQSGFGADKSTGRGVIEKVDIKEVQPFPIPEGGADAVMSLSLGVPGPELGIDASYRIRVKFGKLGGHFATSGNPFKMPIMMMEAGAVFPISNPPIAIPLYLSKVSDYHPDIKHHAGMILYPLHLKEAA